MRNATSIPRATMVRERQKQQTEEKIKRTTRVIQQPIQKAATPMVSRRGAYAVAYPAKSKQTKSRQYNYAVGATGAEIRLPAISSINIGWRFLSFFLGIFCLVGIYLLFNSAEFRVNQIQTSGLLRLNAADLDAVMKINGESIIWMDANQVKQDLTIAFPELKDIQISVEFPNQVTISAFERQPVLLWQTEKQAYWMDQEGVLIPPRGEVGDLLTIQASAAPPLVILPQDLSISNLQEIPENSKTAQLSVAQLQGWGETVDPVMIDAAYELMAFLPPNSQILY
ncbi:MAG: FtsQ-type POTRA domain-containing protein, partial [Anaerolineaceae bacterium]|nr:FtsQ-type POTRA domain-containing protein [Anaerolineaceae bacterium]